MSVTVKHLNGDSTFLLIFSAQASPLSQDLKSANGAFSVLIDPWLSGPSIVTAPWFAKTLLRTPSAIHHLSEIDEPDVVVVSQNKPDHCHKETLLQLRPEGKTIIAAEPGAAKAIKSWNHFDPHRVHGLLKYDPKVKFGRSLRLRIPPLSESGLPGELTISFVPAKNYMTGLHNAFGITYRPPTHIKTTAPLATVDLPRTTRYYHMPLSPATLPPGSPPPMSPMAIRPMSLDQLRGDREVWQGPRLSQVRRHRPQLSKTSNTASSELLPGVEVVPSVAQSEERTVVHQTVTVPYDSPRLDVPFHFELGHAPFSFGSSPPTPPHSPGQTSQASTLNLSSSTDPTALSSSTSSSTHRKSSTPSHKKSLSSVSSCPNLSPVTPARPQAMSVIYSPHGVPLSDLQAYVQTHLVQLGGALPLTILLHSFDHAQNPWFLGGNIMTGMQGGAEIARALMARCWISAHDEPKDDRGLSVKKLRVKRGTADEARKTLWQGEEGEWLREKGWTCDVRSLEVGKEMFIGPARDLCMGMESNRESRLLRFEAPVI